MKKAIFLIMAISLALVSNAQEVRMGIIQTEIKKYEYEVQTYSVDADFNYYIITISDKNTMSTIQYKGTFNFFEDHVLLTKHKYVFSGAERFKLYSKAIKSKADPRKWTKLELEKFILSEFGKKEYHK